MISSRGRISPFPDLKRSKIKVNLLGSVEDGAGAKFTFGVESFVDFRLPPIL